MEVEVTGERCTLRVKTARKCRSHLSLEEKKSHELLVGSRMEVNSACCQNGDGRGLEGFSLGFELGS